MLALTFRIEEDIRKAENFRRAGFAKIMKACLQQAVLEWQGKFIGYHFTRDAYTRYRSQGVYTHRKRRGEPLVESGSLRDRMKRRRSLADVHGTSKQASVRLPIGRPPKYTEAEIERLIRQAMRKGMTRRAAQNKVYSMAGYSRDAKRIFLTHIPAVSGPEVQSLRAFLRKRIVELLNERAQKKTTTITG